MTKTTPATAPDETTLAARITEAEAGLEAARLRLANAKTALAAATETTAALLERYGAGDDDVEQDYAKAAHAEELAAARRKGTEEAFEKAEYQLRLARCGPIAARAAALIAKIKAAPEDEDEAATVNARVITARVGIQQEVAALIRDMQDMRIAETNTWNHETRTWELPLEKDAYLGWRSDGRYGGAGALVQLGTERAAPEAPAEAMERITRLTEAKAGLNPGALRK